MGELDPLSKDELEAEDAPRGDGTRVMRALVVGITAYDDPALALKMEFSSEAAARMAASLESRGYLVRQLHDEPHAHGRPTLAAVKRELRAIMKAADEDDTVLFYFGGHGVLERKRGVLLLADARARRKRYVAGAMPVTELLRLLRGRPRFTVVLLDACHMGLALDPGASDSTAAVNEREGAGGFALLSGSTSDDLTQDALRGKIKGGAFTVALIAGLDGGVVDPDGGVRFSSLARFVQQHVEKWKQGEGRTINATQKAVVRLEVADVQVVPPPRDYRDLTPAPTGAIIRARFSDDGRSLVTAGADRAVRLWDAATCTPLRPARRLDEELIAVELSENGSQVLAVCRSGVTKAWSLIDDRVTDVARIRKRGQRAPRLGRVNDTDRHGVYRRALATTEGLFIEALHPDPDLNRRFGRRGVSYGAVRFSAMTGVVVSGDADGNLCLWGGEGQETVIMEHRIDGPVRALDVGGPDDRYVVAGGAEPDPAAARRHEPVMWSVWSNEALSLGGHGGAVTAIAFAPDGTAVATACRDGLVRLFAIPAGTLTRTLSLGPGAGRTPPAATALCYSPDGRQLFVGYASGRGRRFQL